MKKGTVFIAPPGARDKKANIFNKIVDTCPTGDYSGILYITPNAFSQAEAKKGFFSYLKTLHKKTAYIPFQSFPLKQLYINLYAAYGRKKIISAGIRPLLLCEILKEKNIGYAVLLSELFYKIRHYITDKDLPQIKEEIKELIFEEKAMARAVNAMEILEDYEKRLDEKGLTDSESAAKESISFINEFLNPSLLVLDGFFDPTPLELAIIKALIDKAGRFIALLDKDAGFLKFFEQNPELSEMHTIKAGLPKTGSGYFTYPSMEDEVEGIAKGVKGLILEGTSPEEIIISFPAFQKYLPMLRRVFKKYGLLLSIAGYDLSNAKPVTALEDMIASIEDDYPRNEFLSFLTSTHFPEVPAVVKEWAVAYANKAGILKGKQAWLSMKTVLLDFSGEQFTKDEESRIAEVQEGIRSVIGILDEIKSAKDLASYMENLENALNKFGFMESLDESLSEALSSLFLELRQFSGMSGPDAGSKEAGIYLRHLFTGLSGADADRNGVRVVPYEFAAGHESRALFLGGMVEDEFPSKPGIDPILPEKVKQALGMPFLEYYLERQKRYFKRLVNVPLLEPYFSCPSAEGDKPFLPSPFLDWGQSLTPAELNLPSDEERLIAEGFSEQKEFTGILWNGELPEEREIKNLLSKRFGQDAFISVTDIETYRKCPLRFYIEKVLRLEIEKPPKFEVEAMLWGKLAHKVMEYLYKDGDIGLKDISSRIMQGLKLTLAEFQLGNFWSKVAREIFQRLIPMIEAQEAEIKMQGFMPHASEKGLKAEINGLRLKGKIDRIDRRGQGAFSFILLDYKTGSIDKDSLQLPLYSAMWQKENEGMVEKAGFYSLKDGGIDWYPAKKQGMEEFIQDALQITKELVQKMREGMFMPSEVKEAECRYCQHRALCKGGAA